MVKEKALGYEHHMLIQLIMQVIYYIELIGRKPNTNLNVKIVKIMILKKNLLNTGEHKHL